MRIGEADAEAVVAEMEEWRPQTLEVDELPTKEWWRQEELGVTMKPVAVGMVRADDNTRLSTVPHVKFDRENQRTPSHVCCPDHSIEGNGCDILSYRQGPV